MLSIRSETGKAESPPESSVRREQGAPEQEGKMIPAPGTAASSGSEGHSDASPLLTQKVDLQVEGHDSSFSYVLQIILLQRSIAFVHHGLFL